MLTVGPVLVGYGQLSEEKEPSLSSSNASAASLLLDGRYLEEKPAENSFGGVIFQLMGLTASACKYVFAHAVMRECKKELGSPFAFVFWLDLFALVVVVPMALILGDTRSDCLFAAFTPGCRTDVQVLFAETSGVVAWGVVLGNSFLGGVRFFSQLLVLRFTTATNLAAANIAYQALNIYVSLAVPYIPTPAITGWLIGGSMLTILTSAVYTYWNVSKVLTNAPTCIKVGEDFNKCVGCTP